MSSTINLQTQNPVSEYLPVSLACSDPSQFGWIPNEAKSATVPAPTAEFARVIADNMPMVRAVARQLHARLPRHVDFEELVSAGVLGLVDAASRFKADQQAQFKTYAHFRVRGAMLDLLRSTDWSPRTLRRQARLIEQAVQVLASRGLQSPTDADIATELGLPLASYHQLLGELKGLEMGSLQVERHEESGDQEIEYVPGPASADPLFRCLEGEMRERMVEAIETLPEKERLVLNLYYYEELTMREVSQVMGVGQSRVSQMHSSAVLRLRSMLSGNKAAKSQGCSSH